VSLSVSSRCAARKSDRSQPHWQPNRRIAPSQRWNSRLFRARGTLFPPWRPFIPSRPNHAGAARTSMNGKSGQTGRTTTAEMRLDHGKAAGSGLADGHPGGLAANGRGRDRIWLRWNLQGGRIRSNGPGIRGMSGRECVSGETPDETLYLGFDSLVALRSRCGFRGQTIIAGASNPQLVELGTRLPATGEPLATWREPNGKRAPAMIGRPRIYANATILPTGEVFVSGGKSELGPGTVKGAGGGDLRSVQGCVAHRRLG
jgi:hypothetical protein